jgi:hypothetical protein
MAMASHTTMVEQEEADLLSSTAVTIQFYKEQMGAKRIVVQ